VCFAAAKVGLQLHNRVTEYLVPVVNRSQHRGRRSNTAAGVQASIAPFTYVDTGIVHPPVLSDEVHNAPTVVPLLNVLER
jgi:hypothetical protein